MKNIARMKIQVSSGNAMVEIRNAPKIIKKRKGIKTGDVIRSIRMK